MKPPQKTDTQRAAVAHQRLVRHPVEIRGRLREMEGDLHHSDLTLSNQDRCAGEMMAHEIGDLYIDHFNEAPVEQWSKVMRALRAHGYEISFPANAKEHTTPTENHER
jgi:hypothetical protein